MKMCDYLRGIGNIIEQNRTLTLLTERDLVVICVLSEKPELYFAVKATKRALLWLNWSPSFFIR